MFRVANGPETFDDCATPSIVQPAGKVLARVRSTAPTERGLGSVYDDNVRRQFL